MIPLKDNVPTSRLPLITLLLVIINIGVFGWQLSISDSDYSSPQLRRLGLTERDQATVEYGAIPYRILNPGRGCAVGVVDGSSGREAAIVCQGTEDYRRAAAIGAPFEELATAPWYVTLITALFMHGGFLHIAFNMLFLWIFGGNVEDRMGRFKFLLFYLLAGVVADFSQALLNASSTIPTIGASGAVAGVLGAYALLLPRARILTLIFLLFIITVVEIPAYVMLGIWFLLQFLPALGQVSSGGLGGDGVAYFAHVGGFAFGLLAVKLFVRRRRGSVTGPPLISA